VRVLGVDDFAFRKGCTYGTILVDLEKRRPIDLLADREAETLARWLREHPPVEVVARDRSPIYAEGIKNGSPNTVQVADRWHLLKNLRESGRRFLMRENKLLQEAARHLNAISRKGDKISWRRRVSLSSRPKNINGENERRCLYQQAVELHQQGLSGRAIARTLNLHRATIRRFLENETYPARMPRALRPSLLDPYIDYLEKRLREDCWNAGQLWREVRARGYPGGTKMVSRYVTARRSKSPLSPSAVRDPEIRLPLPVPSVEQVSWWMVLAPGKLKPDEKTFLESLSQVSGQAQEISQLIRKLVEIIKRQDENGLTVWLQQAQNSQVKEIRGFAFGLTKDEAAVRQAVISKWSNGQTEGQVNRLKTIKRQMFGRANFDLLKARVLYQG
jgi:transposase